MTYIENFLQRFFQRIKTSVSVNDTAMACFRIFFGLGMLTTFLPSWSWLGDVPPAFFKPRPLSVAYLADGHLPQEVYLFFDVFIIVLFVFLILGFFTRATLLVLFVLSSVLYSFSYTFDKIDHYTTVLMFTYLCMAFTNSGTQFAVRKDKKRSSSLQSRALATLALIICFGMFTAGFPKFINWVDFDLGTSGFLNWFYTGYFNVDNNKLLTPYIFGAPPILFEFLDYTAAIFEITGIYFLWKGKKHWVFYILVATLFHLANLFVLNIDFTQNVICYAIFVLPTLFYRHYEKFAPVWKKYYKIGIGVVVAIALFKVLKALSVYHVEVFESFYFTSAVSTLYSVLVIAASLLFLRRPLKPVANE
jgi:hypothetical protein